MSQFWPQKLLSNFGEIVGITYLTYLHLTSKIMEKLTPNRAQLFLPNKHTVFTMGGTVALRSVNKIFPESYSSAAKTTLCSSRMYC